MTSKPLGESRVAKAIEFALNSHGFGLQYAAFAAAHDARVRGESLWVCEGLEIPFSVGVRHGRIDMVLRNYQTELHLCVEFKRTNPALNRWVFAQAPLLKRARQHEVFILEEYSSSFFGTHNPSSLVQGVRAYSLDRAHHVAFVARGEGKGENDGHSTRNDIEDAATQACAGTNGLLEHWVGGHAHTRSVVPKKLYAAPVIVTTAELFSVESPLDAADLATGNFVLAAENVQSVDWVYLQYPTSPGIRTTKGSVIDTPDLCHMLDAFYLRTIPVVRATAFTRWLKEGLEWETIEVAIAGKK